MAPRPFNNSITPCKQSKNIVVICSFLASKLNILVILVLEHQILEPHLNDGILIFFRLSFLKSARGKMKLLWLNSVMGLLNSFYLSFLNSVVVTKMIGDLIIVKLYVLNQWMIRINLFIFLINLLFHVLFMWWMVVYSMISNNQY